MMSSQLKQFAWDPAGIRGHPYNYTLTFLAKISGMTGGDAYAGDNTELGFFAWPFPLVFKILMGGDCNGDGRINYKDLGILAVAYGSNSTIPSWDARADFNGDGRVNYKDLGILAVPYGKTYT